MSNSTIQIDQSTETEWRERYLGFTQRDSLKAVRIYMQGIGDHFHSMVDSFAQALGRRYPRSRTKIGAAFTRYANKRWSAALLLLEHLEAIPAQSSVGSADSHAIGAPFIESGAESVTSPITSLPQKRPLPQDQNLTRAEGPEEGSTCDSADKRSCRVTARP